MSSLVYYFYFSPVIDKPQLICYTVIPLWFLILISLFDSTVVTKENLHLKNNSKLTTMSVSNENENESFINEFVKCAMTYMLLEYDLKNFLTWKKRLLIRNAFVLIDIKTECSTWSSIAQKVRVLFVAYIRMCQRCLLQNRRVLEGVKHRKEREHSSL